MDTRYGRLLCALLASGIAVGLPAFSQDMPAPIAAAVPVLPAPVLTAEAASVRDGLPAALASRSEGERAAIFDFYADRGFAPFWTETGATETGARGADLVAALTTAPAQALPAARYHPETVAALLERGSEAPAALREAAAMFAYLALAGDLSAGVLKPASINPEMAERPRRPAPGTLLEALNTGSVPQVIAGFQPAAPDYARLIAEKARLEAEARTASWGAAVPEGPTLHPGDTDARVVELRARLARIGYVTPHGEPGPVFDEGLKQSVERFQADYGLANDGVVGAMTLDAINAPATTRLEQVAVNLERMRWADRDPGARYLWVNIPDFTVKLVDDGTTIWQSRVVVGKAHVTESAEFSGQISYMVVNPSWHIPDSIAIRDYLPKLKKDPLVLKRQNIDLMTRGGTVINPTLVDFTQYTPENFPFRIKQRPNEDNALGKVKFIFPNEFSIYLHDTPHKEYFARDVRAYSNGCIRVQKPDELATILLTGQVPDPEVQFEDWVGAKTERTVALDRKMPVHLVYRTVFYDDAGAIHFRQDVYGRDAQVFDALEAAGVTLPTAES